MDFIIGAFSFLWFIVRMSLQVSFTFLAVRVIAVETHRHFVVYDESKRENLALLFNFIFLAFCLTLEGMIRHG